MKNKLEHSRQKKQLSHLGKNRKNTGRAKLLLKSTREVLRFPCTYGGSHLTGKPSVGSERKAANKDMKPKDRPPAGQNTTMRLSH